MSDLTLLSDREILVIHQLALLDRMYACEGSQASQARLNIFDQQFTKSLMIHGNLIRLGRYERCNAY